MRTIPDRPLLMRKALLAALLIAAVACHRKPAEPARRAGHELDHDHDYDSDRADNDRQLFRQRRYRDERHDHVLARFLRRNSSMLRRLIVIIALATATVAAADTSTVRLLQHAWPGQAKKVSEIGRGVGVVFSPDLSVPNNCSFYRTLGFACFQDADWSNVLTQIHTFNLFNPDRRIGTLILETHGTNGNGLKVQESYDPAAPRSYISVGALQERLETEGVFYVIISACNSGRLLRPAIYNHLNPYCGDKLFLPATNGIVDADDDFDPRLSAVMIIRPESSHIETTLVGRVAELRPTTRRAVQAAAAARGITLPKEFAVSDM